MKTGQTLLTLSLLLLLALPVVAQHEVGLRSQLRYSPLSAPAGAVTPAEAISRRFGSEAAPLTAPPALQHTKTWAANTPPTDTGTEKQVEGWVLVAGVVGILVVAAFVAQSTGKPTSPLIEPPLATPPPRPGN